MRVVLLLAVAFSLSVPSAAPRAQAPFQTFKDTNAGLGFRYPNGWQFVDPILPGVFLYLVSADGFSDCAFWNATDLTLNLPDEIPAEKVEQIVSALGATFNANTENYKTEKFVHRNVGNGHIFIVNFTADMRVASGNYPTVGRIYVAVSAPRGVAVVCGAPSGSPREMLRAFDLITSTVLLLPLPTDTKAPSRDPSPLRGTWKGQMLAAGSGRSAALELVISSIAGTEVFGSGEVGGDCAGKIPFFRGSVVEPSAIEIREELPKPCGVTTFTLKPDGGALRGSYVAERGAGAVLLRKQ